MASFHSIYNVPFHLLCEFLDLDELKSVSYINRYLKKRVYDIGAPCVTIKNVKTGIIWMKICLNVKLEAPRGFRKITPDHLARLTRLTYLFLHPFPANGNFLSKTLISLKYLNHLNLMDNDWLEDHHLINLTSLTKLNLSNTRLITDAGISTLTKLEDLTIRNNEIITDIGIRHLTNLKLLILHETTG
ncbi:MAG: hypothetical protein Hyperionvirus34_1, partial [Hyperionvirus sp.]